MAKGMCDLHKNFPHSEPFFAFHLPVSDLYQGRRLSDGRRARAHLFSAAFRSAQLWFGRFMKRLVSGKLFIRSEPFAN
jgi:hypothetical protein